MFWKARDAKATYQAPKTQAHRSFVYLDDDIVVNSLSAMEAGKVDEVIERAVRAQSAALGAKVKVGSGALAVEGGASSDATESLQSDVIRRRTRFSIFESWHATLAARAALGHFSGWDEKVIDSVKPGHTVELRGSMQLVPLQVIFRLFLWYVDEASAGSPLFASQKQAVQALKPAAAMMRSLLGSREQANFLLTPIGDDGPAVLLPCSAKWLVEPLGTWEGDYTVVGQVDRIVPSGESLQAIRLTEEVPATDLERTTVTNALQAFVEPAKEMGVNIEGDPSQLDGPIIVMRPIAIYR